MAAARCGTPSGHKAHERRGEKPCDACFAAKSAYDKRQRAAGQNTIKNRLSAQAQRLAYGQLAAIYPDVYRALYVEHKERIFREAGLEVFAFGEGRRVKRERVDSDA